jgi:NDP-sugar pyrophosphorylase family protein
MGALTDNCPKPMLSIAGRPIIEHLVANAVGAGLTAFTIHLGYLGKQISDHFGSGEAFGASISYIDAPVENPVHAILGFAAKRKSLCCFCGDTVLSVQQIYRLVRTHFQRGSAATFAQESEVQAAYPPVSVRPDGLVSPDLSMNAISVGCNGILEDEFLVAGRSLLRTKPIEAMSALMTALASEHQMAVVDVGHLVNINTPEDLNEVQNWQKYKR